MSEKLVVKFCVREISSTYNMSLGSRFLENIPHLTFAPTEHQVECVKVAGESNLLTHVLIQLNEESVLVLVLVREVALCERCKAALLVFES